MGHGPDYYHHTWLAAFARGVAYEYDASISAKSAIYFGEINDFFYAWYVGLRVFGVDFYAKKTVL